MAMLVLPFETYLVYCTPHSICGSFHDEVSQNWWLFADWDWYCNKHHSSVVSSCHSVNDLKWVKVFSSERGKATWGHNKYDVPEKANVWVKVVFIQIQIRESDCCTDVIFTTIVHLSQQNHGYFWYWYSNLICDERAQDYVFLQTK